MKAHKGNIVVKPYPPDDISEGGIVVPDSFKQRPSKAYVVSVGKEVNGRKMNFKEGDTVFHVKGAGTPEFHNGEMLYILRDVDCLAFIKAN